MGKRKKERKKERKREREILLLWLKFSRALRAACEPMPTPSATGQQLGARQCQPSVTRPTFGLFDGSIAFPRVELQELSFRSLQLAFAGAAPIFQFYLCMAWRNAGVCLWTFPWSKYKDMLTVDILIGTCAIISKEVFYTCPAAMPWHGLKIRGPQHGRLPFGSRSSQAKA